MILDILLFVFIICIFAGCIYASPKNLFDDYLSYDSTLALRGIMAVEIVLYHMADNAVGGILFRHLGHFGYIPVPVFFFLSGYGLIVSFNKKGNNYLKGFWKNRILYLVIIYALVYVIYSCITFALGKEITILGMIKNFFTGVPPATALWYILVQLALYIIFWMAFKIKTGNKQRIAIVFICVVALSVLLYFVKSEIHWYQSNFAFPLGLLWGEYKEKIEGFIKKGKNYIVFMACSLLITVVSLGIIYVSRHFDFYFEIINIIFRNIFGLAATIDVILLLRVMKPNSRYWKSLGSISLEIYLFHSLAWTILRNQYFSIKNNALWTILTLILSILIAYFANKVNKKISGFLKKSKSV